MPSMAIALVSQMTSSGFKVARLCLSIPVLLEALWRRSRFVQRDDLKRRAAVLGLFYRFRPGVVPGASRFLPGFFPVLSRPFPVLPGVVPVSSRFRPSPKSFNHRGSEDTEH